MKICVYAICKNESQFVNRWLDSMQEADYIVVLDTGSTDNTYEMLAADPRVTRVEQKTYSQWRFDVARNDSLDLAPADTDLFICTDLDEILNPGWAAALKEQYEEGYTRYYYKYAWSHTESGAVQNVFWYDKIHTKGYRWKCPVHEYLHTIDGLVEVSKYLDERIFLHHYPDTNKSRGSYLSLLELRVQEEPNDFYGKFYLAREYNFYNRYEDSIKLFTELLNSQSIQIQDKFMQAIIHCWIGSNYFKQEEYNASMSEYLMASLIVPSLREPYLRMGEIYNIWGLYDLAIGAVEQGFRNSKQYYNWLECGQAWTSLPYDILSIAYYYIGNTRKAKEYLSIALAYEPNNERLKTNMGYLIEE